MRHAGLVVIALLLAACSSRAPEVEAEVVPTPLAFQADSSDGGAAPSDQPDATPKPLYVKLVKRTKSVQQNQRAPVTIQTSKKARCSIIVMYMSGPSTAKGLGEKKTDSKGRITWRWRVGGRTTPGTWPISVFCSLGGRTGTLETEFRVK